MVGRFTLFNIKYFDYDSYNNSDIQFKIRSVDKAGNRSAWGEVYYFKTDNIAPNCQVVNTKYANYSNGNYSNNAGTYNSGAWYNGYVISNASCNDSLSGCSTYLTVTGAATNLTNEKKTKRGVVTQGTSNFNWVAKDNAGNSKNCGITTIKLDRKAPNCKVSMIKSKTTDYTKTSNYDGSWYSGYARSIPSCDDNINETNSGCSGSYNVVVDATKSYAVAGTFKKIKYRGVSAEGYTKHTWTISDNAGNSRTCKAVGIKLDRSAPSCTSSKSNLYTSTGVTASFKCSDNPSKSNSKVASCTATQKGLKSNKKYSIKDNAGNSGTCSVSVSAYTQYSKRTRSSWWDSCATGRNTCSGGYDCRGGYVSRSYVIDTGCVGRHVDASCASGYTKRNCSQGKSGTSSGCGCDCVKTYWDSCASSVWNSCKTGSNTCRSGTKYGSWSGYGGWSSDNHCPNYSNSSTCEQRSRTAYR